LWNAGVGYKFLKNKSGEIRATVFDLLKQNQSINRNVTETYVEDSYTRVLSRYFLFSFTYTFRKFTGMKMPEAQPTDPMRGPGGHGSGH
jgi:vacuolar-type H+-ATPase subunit D/Vma8